MFKSQVKKSYLILLTISFSQVLTLTVGAAEFPEKPEASCMVVATPAAHHNAALLGIEVLTVLEHENKKYKAQKLDMKVALIGRRGTALGKSVILNDYDKSGRYLTVKDIHNLVNREYESQGEYKRYTVSNLTKQMFGDPKKQLPFSHMGAMLRNNKSQNGGVPWKGVHKLKPCYDGKSHIYNQGLARFFLDVDFDELRDKETDRQGRVLLAQIVIPKLKYHDILERLLYGDLSFEPSYRHIPYNLAALPFQTKEINSNQYVLEAVAAMQRPESELKTWTTQNFRIKAQEILRKTQYRPTKFSLGGLHEHASLVRVLTGMFGVLEYANPNVQPYAHESLVELVTIPSIVDYMKRLDLVEKEIFVYLPARNIFADDEELRKKLKAE